MPFSQVTRKEIQWLWPGHFPLGKLTVIDGDPDLGKSMLGVTLAAHVSTGRQWPDGTDCPVGNAILISYEDSVEDITTWRLEAAQADQGRIFFPQDRRNGDVTEFQPIIPDDLDKIERMVEKTQAKLLVIDPLMAALSEKVNAWNDQQVRRPLSKLQQMAAKHGVAVIVVRHLNKKEGMSAVYRGGSSIGVIAAARAGYVVATDPENPETHVLAAVKFNIGRKPKAWNFTIEERNEQPYIKWGSHSVYSANELINPKKASRLDDAAEWLDAQLMDGPTQQKALFAKGRKAGHAESTLQRAKKKLRVKSTKTADGWQWKLPDLSM